MFSIGATDATGRPRVGRARRFARLLLGVAPLLVVSTVRAQPSDLDAQRAEQLFQEGRDAMKRHSYPEACPKFRQSLELQNALGTLLNLAVCEERLGHLLLARRHFQEFVAQAPPEDERRALVMGYLEELERRLPRLIVNVGANAPHGLRISLDGRVLSASELGRALVVDPGAHLLVISAMGRTPREIRLEVSERQLATQMVDFAAPVPERSQAPASSPSPGPSDREQPSRTLAYWAAGTGLVAIAVGTVTGVLALQKKRTVDAHCQTEGNRMVCDREGLDAIPTGKTLANVSTAAFALGLVGVGAGAYFYFAPAAEHGSPGVTSRGVAFELGLEKAF